MVEVKDLELDDLLDKLADIHTQSHSIYISITTEQQIDGFKDVRAVFFRNFVDTIQTYYIAAELSKFFTSLSIVQKLAGETDIDKAESLNRLRSSYHEEMKSSFFISFFVNFETTIRVLAEFFIEEVKSSTNLEVVVKKLLEFCSVDDSLLRLFQILIYTRNTIHFSGIRTKETNIINYKDKDYKFEKGEPPSFLEYEGIIYLLSEANDAMKQLILTPNIASEKLIEHPSTKFFVQKI